MTILQGLVAIPWITSSASDLIWVGIFRHNVLLFENADSTKLEKILQELNDGISDISEKLFRCAVPVGKKLHLSDVPFLSRGPIILCIAFGNLLLLIISTFMKS